MAEPARAVTVDPVPLPPIARRALTAAEPFALAAVDALVAVAVVAAAVLMRPPGSGAAVWVLSGAVGAPLAVRRRWPVPVLGVVLAAGAGGLLVGIRPEPVVYAAAYALYPIALRSARAGGWALAAAVAAGRGRWHGFWAPAAGTPPSLPARIPRGRWRRSGCGSPATCTTWSVTT
jgi:hypothetical protein